MTIVQNSNLFFLLKNCIILSNKLKRGSKKNVVNNVNMSNLKSNTQTNTKQNTKTQQTFRKITIFCAFRIFYFYLFMFT